MSNRAYEKALEEYNDEHRFDDKEVTVYTVDKARFNSIDSAYDYCRNNNRNAKAIKKETYKVDWQGSRI